MFRNRKILLPLSAMKSLDDNIFTKCQNLLAQQCYEDQWPGHALPAPLVVELEVVERLQLHLAWLDHGKPTKFGKSNSKKRRYAKMTDI